MKISTKLFLGFGASVIGLILVVAISLVAITSLKKSVDSTINIHYPNVQTAWAIHDDAKNISGITRDLIILDSKEAIETELENAERLLDQANGHIAALEEMTTDPQGILLINKLKRVGDEYVEFQGQVLNVILEGDVEAASLMLISEGAQFQEPLFNILEDLILLNQQKMDDAVQSSETIYDQIMLALIILPALLILLGVSIVWWYSRSIVMNLRKVSSVMDQFAQGKADPSTRLLDSSQDELGIVAASFNRMAQVLQEQKALEDQWNLQNREQVWLHSNIAEVYGTMQDAQSVEEFVELILSEFAQRIDVSCGLLYDLKDDHLYYLSGTYAVSNQDKEKLKASVEAGEGVIGQAAISREWKVLNDVSVDDLKITSGFSEIPKVHIYIIPIVHESRTEGVLELITTNELTLIQEQFLQQLSVAGALILRKIKDRMAIEKLLKASQELSEELNVQQEELMQSNAELEEQTVALEESEQRLQAQQTQLEEINSNLEEKAEELERQTQQLIATSAYKSEFLANMSHELRTPLNSMLILTKLLAENKDGNLSDKQIEFAGTVHSSGNDLLKLINEILELAKIESGKMHVNMERIHIDELVETVKSNYDPVAGQKGIKLIIDIEPDAPAVFESDPLRIQQILRNLLSNSFKFTEKGTVKLVIHSLKKEVNHHILSISVEDTGTGIPLDKQEAIFEAFVQADGTTNRKYGGTGLGLSICRELANLLGGRIEVKSTFGEGSVFTLILPLNEQLSSVESLQMPPVFEPEIQALTAQEMNLTVEKTEDQLDTSFSGKTVLIVDDDVRNLFAMSSRLEDYGIEVLYAKNGKESIEMLQQNSQIDLVLMDIMMPEMDGYSAIRLIREIPNLAKLPIITVTARAMQEDRNQSVDAGASDFLVKPVDHKRLLSLLKIWLAAQ